MAQEKKGFIARMLEGKEKSEEYARSTLPTNRWQLFWDVFKGSFGKIFKVNLLVLLFFIPMLVWIFVCGVLDDSNSIIYPFGSNLGVGVGAIPDIAGVAEYLRLQSDLMRFGGIAVCTIIAAIGLSGGMYVIRNMVWTEGTFVANDFWKGVKLNYKNALQAAVVFSLALLLTNALVNLANFSLVSDNVSGFRRFWFGFSKVLSVSFLIYVGLVAFWMLSLGVNYEHKFLPLLKNAAFMAIGMFPQTVFFVALALLPFIFFLFGDGFLIIALMLLFVFGFAYALLVWMTFSQWAFDKFINPKLQGVKTDRGLYNKDGTRKGGEEESLSQQEYKRQIFLAGKSDLVARPIKPIDDGVDVYELPTSFTREDLKKLKDSKQTIIDDTKAYEEEHKNDAKYVEYNKQFEERERALQDDGKKKKKPPKMLGQ